MVMGSWNFLKENAQGIQQDCLGHVGTFTFVGIEGAEKVKLLKSVLSC